MSEKSSPGAGGLHAGVLRIWGMLFVLAGIVGKTVLENGLLGVHGSTAQQLLTQLQTSDTAMVVATLALVCRALYACGGPIFAMLLVEGFLHTHSYGRYLLRLAVTAAVSQIPYSMAMYGVLWSGRLNPAFALTVCLVVLYFYRRYGEKTVSSLAVKAVVTLAAFFWMGILKIDEGYALLVLTAVLWLCRGKANLSNLLGSTAGVACSLFSAGYLASPMSFLLLHFYNGEPGSGSRLARCAVYPALLLAFALLGYYLI